MASRKWKRAVRFNADLPSVTQVTRVATPGGPASYELVSLPSYVASQLQRVLSE